MCFIGLSSEIFQNEEKILKSQRLEQREQGDRKSLVEPECTSEGDETYPNLSTLWSALLFLPISPEGSRRFALLKPACLTDK